jgi:hypothetical protein
MTNMMWRLTQSAFAVACLLGVLSLAGFLR